MQKNQLFKTPFSKAYWSLAAGEMKSTQMLVLAAVLTAMRIAVKSLTIPIGPSLNITFGFFINSVGSMIYGPVISIFASAVSDTLGAVLFPTGAYFFPYIFTEIAGGVIFALFFYRAEITSLRVILARFSVSAVCNLLMDPIITFYYYKFYMGKSYSLFTLPRVIKNLALFPLQCLLLIMLLGAILPVTNRFGYTHTGETHLKITKHGAVLIAVLTIISAGAVFGYYIWKGVITL